MQVEMYYRLFPADYIRKTMENLVKGMNRFTNFYGSPHVTGVLRFVFSPRSGWGYSRIPLFIVSEEYALHRINEPYGKARNFHGNCHEMAHFWWILADTDSPDDWLNEGLAEFSAFRLSREFSGKEFA
jgi:hypothetical protein